VVSHSGTRPTAARSSTRRALEILDCFSAATPALTLSEIARKLGQPVSSTHRQLGELTRWGALERDERGRYQIGLHLWEVGSLAPRSTELRHAALPFLEDLYEVTHENVQVAVLDGNDVVYVERIFSHRATPIVARPGGRMPAHATGVGRVLLAHAEPDVVNEVLAGPLERFTPHTVVDPAELRRELAKIRRDGYAISDRQVEMVSTSVAAPILGPGGFGAVAAISIIVPSRDAAVRRFVPAMLTAARGISRMMGATTPLS
jgi:DNA-binding IclR family transcriptional regulator